MSLRLSLTAVSSAALFACASPAGHGLHASDGAVHVRRRPAAARAAFLPQHGDTILANAVQVLGDAGYPVRSCDPVVGAVATERVEVDVPCAGGTCLARQAIQVKLGHRTAKLIVWRELWDTTVKRWVPASGERLSDGVMIDQAELLARIVDVPPSRLPPALPPSTPPDPCRPPLREIGKYASSASVGGASYGVRAASP